MSERFLDGRRIAEIYGVIVVLNAWLLNYNLIRSTAVIVHESLDRLEKRGPDIDICAVTSSETRITAQFNS